MDVREAHRHSIRHRPQVEASETVGCFYCLAQFPPSEIDEWIDDVDGEGRTIQTALCPRCGIDSVLPGADVPLSPVFLERMNAHWS